MHFYVCLLCSIEWVIGRENDISNRGRANGHYQDDHDIFVSVIARGIMTCQQYDLICWGEGGGWIQMDNMKCD